MKRSHSSEHWTPEEGDLMKRRNSSTLSLTTVASRPEEDLPENNRRRVSWSSGMEDLAVSADIFIEHDEAPQKPTTSSPMQSTEHLQVKSASSTMAMTTIPTQISRLFRVESEDCKTGLVFEATPMHFDRQNAYHKERPARIISMQEALRSAGLEQRCTIVRPLDNSSAEIAYLNEADFLRVHLPGYMRRLEALSGCTCDNRLDREALQFSSIFFTADSVAEAKTAAASLCRLVSRVVTGVLDNGFAIIRPPGHHAEPGMAGGYCIINNVAVAAAYARERLQVAKVLIVDWDVHHGNGTQSIFLEDPNVLYFSVHRSQGGNYYPFLKNGGPTTVGVNTGAGYNVNVGWSHKGMGDDEYYAVWDHVLLPLAREFKPDLVLVSAGFDAADGDMGECHVTSECFGDLTRSLKGLANGKIVCSLEGGYVRSVLGKCVNEVVGALLERNSCKIEEEISLSDIDDAAAKNIISTIAAHRPYWNCFQ